MLLPLVKARFFAKLTAVAKSHPSLSMIRFHESPLALHAWQLNQPFARSILQLGTRSSCTGHSIFWLSLSGL